MSGTPQAGEGAEAFAALMLALSGSPAAGAPALAPALIDLEAAVRAALAQLCETPPAIQARRVPAGDIAGALSACRAPGGILRCRRDGQAMIGVVADHVGAAAGVLSAGVLSAGPAGGPGSGAPTALDGALACLLVETAMEEAAPSAWSGTPPQDSAGDAWEALAIPIAEGRGRGGGPLVWCFARAERPPAPPVPAPSDVRRRLAEAPAGLAHRIDLVPRPLGAVLALREADVIDVGIADGIALSGLADGVPLHRATLLIRDRRIVARVAGPTRERTPGPARDRSQDQRQ